MDRSSAEFKALKAKWYGKLKAKGFDDIEQDEDHLKQWSSQRFGNYNGSSFQARSVYYESVEAYYRAATHFLHSHVFANTLERLIWERHAEGKQSFEIIKELSSRKDLPRLLKKTGARRKKLYQALILRIIKELEVAMKKERSAETDNDAHEDF